MNLVSVVCRPAGRKNTSTYTVHMYRAKGFHGSKYLCVHAYICSLTRGVKVKCQTFAIKQKTSNIM